MHLTGYATHHIETATYDENLVVIFHTKQDIPTFAVLSNEDLDELIEELKNRREWINPKTRNPFKRFWQLRFRDARHRLQKESHHEKTNATTKRSP